MNHGVGVYWTRCTWAAITCMFAAVACSTQAPPGGQEVLGGRQRLAINPTHPSNTLHNEQAIVQLEGQLAQVQHDLRAWQQEASQAASPSTVPAQIPPFNPPPPPVQATEFTQTSSSKPLAKPIKAAAAPPVAPALTGAPRLETGVILGFAPASSRWLPPSPQAPAWLASVLSARQIVLTGTSKASGKRISNEQLALARATTVRDYLISKGVPAGKIVLRTQLVGVDESHTADPARHQQVLLHWTP